jgi:hypothetical protein
LGGSVQTIKKSTDALVVAGKESELDVNADKSKYMVVSLEQNAGRSHSIKIYVNLFERVEELKYLRRTLTNQDSIQEEIKNRLKPGNACYHSVQNLYSLLFKNLKIKIYRTIILIIVSHGRETWSLTLMEERRLRVFGC